MKLISYLMCWFVCLSCVFSQTAHALAPSTCLKQSLESSQTPLSAVSSSSSVPSYPSETLLKDHPDDQSDTVSELSVDESEDATLLKERRQLHRRYSLLSETDYMASAPTSKVLTWKIPVVHKIKSFFRHFFIYYLTYFLTYIVFVLFLDGFAAGLLVIYFLLPRWIVDSKLVLALRIIIGLFFVLFISSDTIAGEASKILFRKRFIDYANRRRSRQKVLRAFGLRYSIFSFVTRPFSFSEKSRVMRLRYNRSYWSSNSNGCRFIRYLKTQAEFSNGRLLSSSLVQTQLVVRYLQKEMKERGLSGSILDIFDSKEEKDLFFYSLSTVFRDNTHWTYLSSGGQPFYFPSDLSFSEHVYLKSVFTKQDYVLTSSNEVKLYKEPRSISIKRYFVLFYILIYLLAMILPLSLHFAFFHAYTVNALHSLTHLAKIAITVLIGTGILMFKQIIKGTIRKKARYLSVRLHARNSRHQYKFPKKRYSEFIMKWRTYYNHSSDLNHTDVWNLLLSFTKSSGISLEELRGLSNYIYKTHFLDSEKSLEQENDLFTLLPQMISLADQIAKSPQSKRTMFQFFDLLNRVTVEGSSDQVYIFSAWAEFLLSDVAVSLFIMDEEVAYQSFMTSLKTQCPEELQKSLLKKLVFTSDKRSSKGLFLNFTFADYHVAYLFLLLVLFFAIGMGFGIVMSDATLPTNISLSFKVIVEAIVLTVVFSSIRSMVVRLMKDPVEWGVEKIGADYFNGYRIRKVVLQLQKRRIKESIRSMLRSMNKAKDKVKPRPIISLVFGFLGFALVLFISYVSDIFFVILTSFGGVVPFMGGEDRKQPVNHEYCYDPEVDELHRRWDSQRLQKRDDKDENKEIKSAPLLTNEEEENDKKQQDKNSLLSGTSNSSSLDIVPVVHKKDDIDLIEFSDSEDEIQSNKDDSYFSKSQSYVDYRNLSDLISQSA